MKIETTQRGFGYVKFNDRYGSKCSLQESSLVEPCIWFGVDKAFEGSGPGTMRMHLTQEMVSELLPLLHAFVDTGKLPYSSDMAELVDHVINPPSDYPPEVDDE